MVMPGTVELLEIAAVKYKVDKIPHTVESSPNKQPKTYYGRIGILEVDHFPCQHGLMHLN
jgi:hypothetical protein